MKDGFNLLQDVARAKYNRVMFDKISVSKDFYVKLMQDESERPGSSYQDITNPGHYSGIPLVAGKGQEEDYILIQGG